MKKHSLFADVPAEERAERLSQIAHSEQFEPVQRPYSEEEKQQIKDFVVEESTAIMEKTDEFKKIQKEFNQAIKKNKEALRDAILTVKRGYSQNEERVFFIDDQEEGVMNAFDVFGEFLYSRKLRPDERQTKILSIEKTGTND